MYDGQLNFNTKIDEKGFNKGTRKINSQVSGLSKSFAKLGTVIAGVFAVRAIAGFVGSAVSQASQLEEVNNVVSVAFGSMAAEVDTFAKSAIESLGMSEYAFKKTASTFMAIGKGMDMGSEMSKNMSLNLTALSGDMASFYNVKQEIADTALKSVYTGETETLKQFGVVMTQTNLKAYMLSKGITKSYESMTEAEKVQVRYGFTMKTLGMAQGDFARTSGSWANQVRVLSERWKEFLTTMGGGFIQLLTPVVKLLNAIVSRLMIVATYFKAFVGAFFGGTEAVTKAGEGGGEAMADMGSSAIGASSDVAKANKKVKGSLAGFDELNTLADNTAGAMEDLGGAAGGDLGLVDAFEMDTSKIGIEIDTSKVKGAVDFVNRQMDMIRSGFKIAVDYVVTDVIPFLTPMVERAKALLMTVFSDLGTLGMPLVSWFQTSFIPMIQSFIPIIANVFSGVVDSILTVFSGIWTAMFPILEVFVTDGLRIFTEFGTLVGDAFNTLFNVAKTIFDSIWTDAISPAITLISEMVVEFLQLLVAYWDEHGTAIWQGIKTAFEKVGDVFQSLWDVIAPLVADMLAEIKWLWDEHISGFIATLLEFVGTAVQGALDFYNGFILPLVQWLIEKLGPTFSTIFSNVLDIVGTALATIIDVASGIIRALGGVINFLVGVFTGDWKKAWKGIGDIVGGIFTSIVGVVKGAINLMIGGINSMIRGLNKVKFKAPDWVPVIGGQNWGVSIPEIPKLAKGAVIPPNSEFMAILGDQKSGTNIETPLATMVDAFKTAISDMGVGGGGEQVIILKLNETELGRATVKSIKNLQRQTGVSLLTV